MRAGGGRGAALTATIVVLTGCASSGGPGDGPSAVPVYASESEVPCRFEVIERVEAQGMVTVPPTPGEQERERSRLLGREGARVGADAVLLPQRRTGVGTAVVAVPVNRTATITIDFVGDAIRFLPGACRDR